jgi:gamma-glutamyltranspeptidase/glutathione hydrolase
MQFDYANPYPSARIPVFALNVVSTSHPLAAQACLSMPQRDGSAALGRWCVAPLERECCPG